MGVKDLWQILSPVCEKKSLWSLQNAAVAIDLSVWICENQQVDYSGNNLYLRNLFFRTSYLLLLGVKPIFVLEGKAPELKYKTLQHRREVQTKIKPLASDYVEVGKRTRINTLQKQCEELLKCMGVSCVYSEGEAEALCALLNVHRIVDGVISKDSDCFLYGARTVYRNFNISSSGGSFEEYNMSSIERKLSLGRNKLVALSLLRGCDYNDKGIEGIGKESALKFLATVSDSDVLNRFKKWRECPEDPSMSKLEKNLRQKANLNPSFPFYEIQNEFLGRTYDVSGIFCSWKQPRLREFVLLVERKFGWNADYAIEKFLPLLSRWHLLHDERGDILQLDYIIKKRTLRGVLSYEVKWKDFDQSIVEPVTYLKMKYDQFIIDFEEKKKSKSKKGKKEKAKPSEDIDLLVSNMSNLNFESEDEKFNLDVLHDESITVSDFECSANDLLELSFIVESIVSRR